MKKFIFFDIDDTLVHTDRSLSGETVEILSSLPEHTYGICTNRPLSDSANLDFLKKSELYICEGGVVCYDSNLQVSKLYPDAIEIDQGAIRQLAVDFLVENSLNAKVSQNTGRVYTSTLYVNESVDTENIKRLGEHVLQKYPFPESYEFTIIGNGKISFSIKSISKEYMIGQIASPDTKYYLISDHETGCGMYGINNITYISINPSNVEFNSKCEYVSLVDFDKRIIDAILYINK